VEFYRKVNLVTFADIPKRNLTQSVANLIEVLSSQSEQLCSRSDSYLALGASVRKCVLKWEHRHTYGSKYVRMARI